MQSNAIVSLTASLSRLSGTLTDPRAMAVGIEAAARTPVPSTGEHHVECPGVVRHVLVPLDGSRLAECAIPWAVAVAHVLAARITLLRVLEAPAARDAPHHDAVEWEIRRAEAHNQLSKLGGELSASGLTVGIELLEGRPAEQIINFARTHHVDLVVLSTHGEGGLSGWALSSTAQMVVARSHTSALVVPAYADEGQRRDFRLRRILVPLDCSPRAEGILPLATALARAHDAELILAHVVPEPEMPRRMPPSAEDLLMASELTERNRLEGERYLGALRDRLAGPTLRVGVRIVVSSRRARAIRLLADEADVGLIVMCAHGRTGDASERYGSVAARLLEASSRPIIVFQELGGSVHERTRAEDAARGRPGH